MTYANGQRQPEGKEPLDWVKDLFVHTPIGLAVMAWKRVPEFVSAVPDLVGQAMAKGCAQLAGAEERISEEVRKARMIGEVAVTFGGRQIRREVDARLRDAKQAAEGLASFLPNMAGDGSNGAGAGDGDATTVTAHATPTAPASPPGPAATKPAAAKAAAKPAAARKAATKATSARKTTGARKTTKTTAAKAGGATKRARRPAAASAADLPIEEYDGLSASQVVSRLSGLTTEELRAIRAYEDGSRGRRTVLLAIDRLLD
jgi:hypothetical protein